MPSVWNEVGGENVGFVERKKDIYVSRIIAWKEHISNHIHQ